MTAGYKLLHSSEYHHAIHYIKLTYCKEKQRILLLGNTKAGVADGRAV